ncbi:MAG: hypothetical protein ACOC3Z_01865 [Nanoarchaeota archaeon]
MKQKIIIFDASTLINFSMNGLYEEIRKLKEIFNGKFLITNDVKEEIINYPIKKKKFELEAIRLNNLLKEGVIELPKSLKVNEKKIQNKTYSIMDEVNSIFKDSQGEDIKIIHKGEASIVALAEILKQRNYEIVLSIDERTMRVLIEKPSNLKKLLERKLKTRLKLNKKISNKFKGLNVIRSSEIVYIIYKKGLMKKSKKLLDALLWAVKTKGCSITHEEIEEIKRIG